MPISGGGGAGADYKLMPTITDTITNAAYETMLSERAGVIPVALYFSVATANTPTGNFKVWINGTAYIVQKANMAQNLEYYIVYNPAMEALEIIDSGTILIPFCAGGDIPLSTLSVDANITGGYTLTMKAVYRQK